MIHDGVGDVRAVQEVQNAVGAVRGGRLPIQSALAYPLRVPGMAHTGRGERNSLERLHIYNTSFSVADEIGVDQLQFA